MKKRYLIIWGIILFLLYWNFISFTPVKYAIPNIRAYWECMNGKALIIHYDENGLGSYYRKGLIREYITLVGLNPEDMIRNRLLGNRILVEGEFRDDMSAFYDEKFFYVTNWEIVFPVTRQYSLSDDTKSRFFSPVFYLDRFDVDTRDLRVCKNKEYSISSKEAVFLASENNSYFVITPEISNNKLNWHIVDYILGSQNPSRDYYAKRAVRQEDIELTGENLPVGNIRDNLIFNDFLIRGVLQKDTINVQSWQIILPLYNIETGEMQDYLDDNIFDMENVK